MSVWYAADCEQVRSGLLGQPANTVSAVGYLVAGGWLLVWARRRRAAPRRYRWFALAVAANGVGSGLYHGPGWPGSGWCHDVAAVAVPVFVAADGWGGIRGWDDRTVTRVAAVATAAAGAGALARPVTTASMAVAVTAAVLAEAAVARRPPPAGGGRAGRAVVVAALAAGVTAYLLGRTGGPLCRPDSLLQPHALWHLLTAVAMASWAADRIALAEWRAMSSSDSASRSPVEVAYLPVVRCAVCRRTVAHRPGEASAVLTKHYERVHPEMLAGE